MVSHTSPEFARTTPPLDEPGIVELFITRVQTATETGERPSTKLARVLENPTKELGRDLTADEFESIKNVLRGFADNDLRREDFLECTRLLGKFIRAREPNDGKNINASDFDDEPTDPEHQLDIRELEDLADKGLDEDGIENA